MDDASLSVIVAQILKEEQEKGDRRKRQLNRGRRKYYRTDNGRRHKSAENKRYYARKRGQRQIQTPASLDGESS
ncbi:MAG: hypothetical protein LBQ50_02805 [Planctomycetaceae bacterium]|nr:hypothetical protein [Planctomycetaceae bacterium]